MRGLVASAETEVIQAEYDKICTVSGVEDSDFVGRNAIEEIFCMKKADVKIV